MGVALALVGLPGCAKHKRELEYTWQCVPDGPHRLKCPNGPVTLPLKPGTTLP